MDTQTKPVKVLVIEDDHLIVELVTLKLTQNGYDTHYILNGTEALDTITSYQPDTVILDLMLPGRSGQEILAEIKSRDDLCHIPVMIFSNVSQDDQAEELLKKGAKAYMVKASTDLDDLVKKVGELAASPDTC
jgi:CheY-like chemotaxis protein